MGFPYTSIIEIPMAMYAFIRGADKLQQYIRYTGGNIEDNFVTDISEWQD